MDRIQHINAHHHRHQGSGRLHRPVFPEDREGEVSEVPKISHMPFYDEHEKYEEVVRDFLGLHSVGVAFEPETRRF